MAKYDWNKFRNYIAFTAGEMVPGTRRPHHDNKLTSWYHDAFVPWDHYHNNIVLFYHDSPLTRSHFMDPTDRAIKGFYCKSNNIVTCFSSFFVADSVVLCTKGSHCRAWNTRSRETLRTWVLLSSHIMWNKFLAGDKKTLDITKISSFLIGFFCVRN